MDDLVMSSDLQPHYVSQRRAVMKLYRELGLAKPASQPAKPASQPAKPTSQPAKPTSQSAKPTSQSAKSASRPAKPTSQPAKPTSQPAKSASRPAKSASRPAQAPSRKKRIVLLKQLRLFPNLKMEEDGISCSVLPCASFVAVFLCISWVKKFFVATFRLDKIVFYFFVLWSRHFGFWEQPVIWL